MNMRYLERVALTSVVALIAILLTPPLLLGQNSTGNLSILVKDGGGAVVVNAEISVTGTDTGEAVRTLKSNDRGLAEVPLLQPGRYNVKITSPGFKSLDREAITVSVGNVVSLDVALEPGESSESITVTGETPLIEEKSETIAQVVSAKEVTDIPLNGRSYLEAANYVPGVIPTSSGRDNSFSAYGNTGLQNAFLLDGARNVNYLRGLDNFRRDMVRPPLDALREFSVQTSNFSAEYGAAAGGVVNAITKSGSNSLHGSAYDFARNDRLDAQNYFAASRPLLVRNQYGGSLGGPIKRDRAFFFAAYEGVHQRDEVPSTAVVPTALERVGNFSQTVNAAGALIPIYDPNTTVVSGTTTRRTAYLGNIIPTAQLNGIGQQFASLYPLPNSPAFGVNIFKRNAPERIDVKNGIARGDIQISKQDSLFARYAHEIDGTNNEAALPSPAANPGQLTVTSKGIGSGYTHIFTPTLINELRSAWTTIGVNSGGTLPRQEIIPGSLDPAVNTGYPNFSVSNIASLGGTAPCCGNSPLVKTSGVFDYSDNVSWSRGKHELKFGGEFLQIRPRTFATVNGRSNFGFTGVFTQNPLARGAPAVRLRIYYWAMPTH